jgi:hypothetical protein
MQTNDQSQKVVSIFDRKKDSTQKNAKESESYDFENTMKRNAENNARMKKERSKSNRGVIRSYRLKH